MSRKNVKMMTIIIVGILSAFFLLHFESSGFISTKQVFEKWGDSYFKNTTILLTVGFLISSIAVGFSSSSIQNLNRNNIATGSTLGIGASASFGYLISEATHNYNYVFMIFIMLLSSILPAFLNFFLITRKKASKANVILLGLAISAIMGVLNYIIRRWIGELNSALIFLGSFHGTSTWKKFYYALPVFLVGFIILVINSKKLTIVSMSMELADKQSINFNRLYLLTTIANLLLIVSVTFFVGEIAFLGIIGTNIARRYIRSTSTISVAVSSSCIGLFVLLIAQIIYIYFDVSILLVVVVISLPIFILTVLKRGKNV